MASQAITGHILRQRPADRMMAMATITATMTATTATTTTTLMMTVVVVVVVVVMALRGDDVWRCSAAWHEGSAGHV